MIGKNAQINVQNNMVFKSIAVKFVKPEQKQEKTLELPSNNDLPIPNQNPHLKLKLVS